MRKNSFPYYGMNKLSDFLKKFGKSDTSGFETRLFKSFIACRLLNAFQQQEDSMSFEFVFTHAI